MKKMRFKTLMCLMIVVLLSVSVNVYASPNSSKAPAARNAKVTQNDISSLNEFISSNTLETQTLSSKLKGSGLDKKRSSDKTLLDKEVSLDWIDRLSKNNELLEFTGISKKDLKGSYVDSIFMGKIQDQYDVYLSTFELPNLSIMTQYDISRDLLIDAYVIDHTDESNVIITDRNIGLVFQGPVSDLLNFKNGTFEDKENFKSKYIQEINEIKESSLEESPLSFLGIGSVSAANDICPGYSGKTCSWVAVGYCGLAGLAGFWPGLACAVFYTWGCNAC